MKSLNHLFDMYRHTNSNEHDLYEPYHRRHLHNFTLIDSFCKWKKPFRLNHFNSKLQNYLHRCANDTSMQFTISKWKALSVFNARLILNFGRYSGPFINVFGWYFAFIIYLFFISSMHTNWNYNGINRIYMTQTRLYGNLVWHVLASQWFKIETTNNNGKRYNYGNRFVNMKISLQRNDKNSSL